LDIIGTLNICSAKTNIDEGVANLIRVSFSFKELYIIMKSKRENIYLRIIKHFLKDYFFVI